jgi:uncharacterized Tic20 family protein
MISSDVTKCRFCSATIDPQAAALGAELQAKVNTACNHAKMLRNAAGAMWLFFLLGLVLPFVGSGATLLFFGDGGGLIYWQIKFGRLKTVDADYKRAKRDWLIAAAIWLPALAWTLVLLGMRFLSR